MGKLARGLSYFRYAPPAPPPGLLLVDGVVASAEEPLPPIVFIHGLGVGLVPYVPFLRRLCYTRREIFVLELPEISQVCCETVLPPVEMVDAVVAMLKEHGRSCACFMAHSYG